MKYCTIILCLLTYCPIIFSQLKVSGGTDEPYKYQEDLGGSGIEAVYLFNTFGGAKIEYESDAALVRFFKYTNSLSNSQQIPNSQIETAKNGNKTVYTFSNLEDGNGYYVEANGAVTAAIWIIDYNKHHPTLKSIKASESGEDCEYLKLLIDKEDDLFFYANSGAVKRIIRKYKIEYNNLVWDATKKSFDEETTTTNYVDIGNETIVDAPLINTIFTLSGDQFGEYFKRLQQIESPLYNAIATFGNIVAEQTLNDGTTTSDIGGSAPAHVNLYGVANEPVTSFYTWQIYKLPDKDNAIVRYTDKDISYTFKESGSYTIELEIADKDSKCVKKVTIDLTISNFSLEVPNFLLLDGEHVFKVSYKSIVDFRCTIFNRWGNEIYSWTDPSKGWDGKYKGKEVNPGVYFYVLTAVGGDGKTHKKAGDINVLKKR